ncbi:MAG: hypothetical protein FWB86_12075 [Treponema sp.]|nr:hypothetical protein [Treponema sp.]
MSRARDYVPTNAVQFREFMQNLLTYTDTHINVDPLLWNNIPADRWDTLAAKFKAF